MKLIRYQVRKFKSIQDSGWITLDQVNALLGENESGKTNLLLPLWKLNPSSGGAIDLLHDAPRGEFTEIRELDDEDKPVFVTAEFSLNNREKKAIATIAGCDEDWVTEVSISRRFDGKYLIHFPNANPPRACPRSNVEDILLTFKNSLDDLSPNKTDTKPKIQLSALVDKLSKSLDVTADVIRTSALQALINEIDVFDMARVSKTGGLLKMRRDALGKLNEILTSISTESPTSNSDARKKALQLMPSFIYFSNYGNLDGEIYLPRVIKDLEKEKLPAKEEAKARTLKVLFEYVKLEPKEILNLGSDLTPQETNDQSISDKAQQKNERTVLLDSAGTAFTKSFSEWWRQGSYTFQFRADGDHFKIWVSDTIRTDPIELENRSTGLQWFFSFFLIFLNERHDTHQGSILLLDEPGVTLHPNAQKDLFSFFEGLSNDNQIIYTTHSPFLMDPDKLDQVKAVYVDKDGYTAVSDDLRARANRGSDSEQKAIFPVHSALGLTVSEVLFVGCRVVLVEGPSDQYYLSSIKNTLVSLGKIQPKKEILFVPAGGTRGIKTTSRILSANESEYPFVLLDGDQSGLQTKKQLEETLYEGRGEQVALVTDFIDIDEAEIEDIVDTNLLKNVASRFFRGQEDFEDIFDNSKSIIPQICKYCESENIELSKGWKVDIARSYKKKTLVPSYTSNLDAAYLERWVKVFSLWLD